jgi:beta-glucosidase
MVDHEKETGPHRGLLRRVRCGAERAEPGADPGAATTARVHPQRWPKLRPALPPDRRLERRIDELLARMTPEQKVGQLIQADIDSITPDDLCHYPLGSILNGGNSSPHGDKLAPPGEWLALADRFYDA